MNTAQVTQVDLETEIMRICDRMERDIDLLVTLSAKRADAEADYRHRHAVALVTQEGKVPVATKDAVAHLKATDEFRAWKLLEAQEKATQQSLLASRSRLDAIRTICANVRAAGG
jgi:hypothetical protein